ncbi:hypothetical protein RF11_06052 [Thelohanellus kitauei]|uniref:Uncharacterized protein n=1 Tax=Thelohanellus kitauei TaxID=669202 RepID=A0A0C2J219_THEKT|nr:hypothetical protein RF11_06052 [Thelohanellus kitauei]
MFKYFFTEVDKKAVCLQCSKIVSGLKEYNISRYYATKHADNGCTLSTEERQIRDKELDRKLVSSRISSENTRYIRKQLLVPALWSYTFLSTDNRSVMVNLSKSTYSMQ